MQFCFNAKAIKHGCSIRLCFPAVHVGKFTFQFCSLQSIIFREIRFHVNGFFFLHNVIQSLVAHDNRIQNGILVILEMVLLQEGETLAGRHGDFSLGGFQFAGKNLQKSRFTGTVSTDQAVAVAFGEFDINIFK